MMKKTLTIVGALVLLAALAACSTIQSVIGGNAQSNPSANGGAANQANGRGGFGGDPTSMTVEQKLGFAILKMDGSPTALSAQQAKDMLPLWQALKSMETSNTASAGEITAIFTQMKDTLTAEQVSAVQKMTWTQADMTALMQQYGVQFGGGGQGGFGGNGTLSPEQQATRTARFAAGGNNRQGGGFPQGGDPGEQARPGGQGGFGGNGGSTAGGATRTPSPAQLNRRAIGLNSIFINPVIQLLTKLAGN